MLKRLTFLVAVSLALGAALALPAAATEIFPFEIHQATLDNGLRMVAVPLDSPGIVSYFTVVRTGSRDEVEPGHSGFAHFFEHMMFQGTEKYSADAYNDELKRMGADSNADTSDDRTRYYITGPAAELETIIDIESDRFKHLDYAEEVFRREALAVLGEYNKNISNPFLPMYEKMRELAFQTHTYAHTTMGFLADIKAMPDYYDYSLSFFDRFYRPGNCILLVVGDVDPAGFFEMAKRYYGDWEKGYQAPDVKPEGPQEEPKTAELTWDSPIRPHLMMGYKAPAFSDSTTDTAALDLISQLLFSESAPLYQQLVVDEQWVDFVSGSYGDHRDPYLFMVYSRVKEGDLVAKVQKAIDEGIAKLQQEPVDAEKLDRIKSHLRYDFASRLDSPSAIASMLSGFLTMTGDPQSVNRVYTQYDKVTPDDIQRIANTVFQPTGQTIVHLSYTEPTEAATEAAEKEAN